MLEFATITLNISPFLYENVFLHIVNFEFIKALDHHRLHYWTFKYAQICTKSNLIKATCSNFQKPFKKMLIFNVWSWTIKLNGENQNMLVCHTIYSG
jgi:hypothetical protein